MGIFNFLFKGLKKNKNIDQKVELEGQDEIINNIVVEEMLSKNSNINDNMHNNFNNNFQIQENNDEIIVETYSLNRTDNNENSTSHIEPEECLLVINKNENILNNETEEITEDKSIIELINDQMHNFTLPSDRIKRIEEKVAKLNLKTSKEKKEWISIYIVYEKKMEALQHKNNSKAHSMSELVFDSQRESEKKRQQADEQKKHEDILKQNELAKQKDEERKKELAEKEKKELEKKELEKQRELREQQKQEKRKRAELYEKQLLEEFNIKFAKEIEEIKKHSKLQEQQKIHSDLKQQKELNEQEALKEKARQAELRQQAEKTRQAELKQQAEIARQSILRRQTELVEQIRQAELKRQKKISEQIKQVELRHKEELLKNRKKEVSIEELFFEDDSDLDDRYIEEFELEAVGIVKYYNSIERFRDNDLYGDTNTYDFMMPLEEMDDFYRYPYMYYPDFEIDADDGNISYLKELDEEEYSKDKEYAGYIRDKIDEYYEYYEKNDFDYEM